MDEYPLWRWFPGHLRPPDFILPIIQAFESARPAIDSLENVGVKSDEALATLRPYLEEIGMEVEAGKKKSQKLRRPSLFGPQGSELKAFEIDAFWPAHGVVLEVEAGRGAQSNAVHRDIIEASLLVDARVLAMAVMQRYTGGNMTTQSYEKAEALFSTIYSSDRLSLPFEGILLIGY